MQKFLCPYCNKENILESTDNIPHECSYCCEKIDQSVDIYEVLDNGPKITGLTITYQINQQQLEISILHKTILGRKNHGAELFSKIVYNGQPVVSRKHCSIEFINGRFYLLDENSLNGTYYGVNKTSCKNSPQIIKDKSIFFIGEEAFLAQINYGDHEQNRTSRSTNDNTNETKKIKQYRCRGCGKNFDEYSEDCPNCNRYNSLVPIYE